MKIKSILILIAFSLIILTCDHGIEPPTSDEPKTGLSGTVYYLNWSSAGDIHLLKIVFFKDFPPQNIIDEVTGGRAKTYPKNLVEGLPTDVDSIKYQIQLKAGEYKYISVAQQYGPDVFSEWRSVGQYNETPGDSLPTAVTVLQDSMLQNINIFVDFDNLPVQYLETP